MAQGTRTDKGKSISLLKPFEEVILGVPDKVKVASAKILSENGYSLQQIAELTDYGQTTVHRIKSKSREELTMVDLETWKEVEFAINNVLKMKRDQLTAKIMGKMEAQIDKKGDSMPFGSLSFALKVLSEMYQPKGQTNNLNLNAPTMNVQVVRGNINIQPQNDENK